MKKIFVVPVLLVLLMGSFAYAFEWRDLFKNPYSTAQINTDVVLHKGTFPDDTTNTDGLLYLEIPTGHVEFFFIDFTDSIAKIGTWVGYAIDMGDDGSIEYSSYDKLSTMTSSAFHICNFTTYGSSLTASQCNTVACKALLTEKNCYMDMRMTGSTPSVITTGTLYDFAEGMNRYMDKNCFDKNAICKIPVRVYKFRSSPYEEIQYLPSTTFKSMTFYYSMFAPSYVCDIGKGNQLVVESFAQGQSISIYSFRYPVDHFCPAHPVIITDNTNPEAPISTSNAQFYFDLEGGKVLTVPADKTYTFFYVMKNNGQIPLVCADAYDPITGKCTPSVGIIFFCSQGVWSDRLMACAVYPEITEICDLGSYDEALMRCVWHPPVQAKCEKGIYNVDTKLCEWTPATAAVCGTGATYNDITKKCEKFPEEYIYCPTARSAYDPTRDKCVYTPAVIGICSNGGTWNSVSGFCELTAPTKTICQYEGASFDPSSGFCIYYPSERAVCPAGVYDTNLKLCLITPDLQYVCPSGVYDPTRNVCIQNAQIEYVCSQGTYDSASNTCKVNPSIQNVCLQGTYIQSTGMCHFYPDVKTICPTGATYNEYYQTCDTKPPVDVQCPPQSTYNPQTGYCISQPPFENYCPKGDYDTLKDRCVWKPSLEIVCGDKGTYDEATDKCIETGDVVVKCTEGTAGTTTEGQKVCVVGGGGGGTGLSLIAKFFAWLGSFF